MAQVSETKESTFFSIFVEIVDDQDNKSFFASCKFSLFVHQKQELKAKIKTDNKIIFFIKILLKI